MKAIYLCCRDTNEHTTQFLEITPIKCFSGIYIYKGNPQVKFLAKQIMQGPLCLSLICM